MASFLSKLKPTKTKDESRYASVYIDKLGLSIAVTPNRFGDCLTVEYLQHIPFEENPTSELINYILDQCVKDHNLKGIPTNCVLSRELYRLILVDLPDNIPKGEIREATKWLVKDLIDFPLDNLASDVFLLPKFSNTDNKAYVCVAKKHMLKVRQQQIITSELSLQNMGIIDLALTALTAQLPENQVHILVSLMPSHSTLLATMNNNLCLKHDIDFTLDLSSESNQVQGLDALPGQIENFASYFLAQLNQNYPVGILILPCGKYTDVIIDKVHNALPYPINKIDVNSLFILPENTDPNKVDHCITALGGLINKG